MHSSDLAPILNRHFANWSSIPPFLCIAWSFLSLSTVTIARLSSSAFMHSTNLAYTLSSHYCTSENHSAIFMHSTDLPLTDSRAFEFYSGVFVYFTDLPIIVSNYGCPSKLQSCLLCIALTLFSPSTVIFASQSSILLILFYSILIYSILFYSVIFIHCLRC